MRKRLSSVKGGKLAQLCYPTTTVSLILSDVIGDPLDVIASGPTVANTDGVTDAWDVIRKYGIESQLQSNVIQVLESPPILAASAATENEFRHVHNFLIGNNVCALEAAENYARSLGFLPLVLSSQIRGEAAVVGRHFAQLAKILTDMASQGADHKYMEDLACVADNLNIPASKVCNLERLIRNCRVSKKNICLISGGETTVEVRSARGRGGRNQELALAWAIESGDAIASCGGFEIVFLSGGTDGQDGPTDAAGAVSTLSLVGESLSQGLDPREFLSNNDSYSFYRQLRDGYYQLNIGQTGTNVMDVQIMFLMWPSNSSDDVGTSVP